MLKEIIEVVEKEKIRFFSFLILYEKYHKLNLSLIFEIHSLIKLQDEKYIKIIDYTYGKFELRQKGIDLVEKVDNYKRIKTISKPIETDVVDWIEEYRELFKGLKPGSMGDKKACSTKMEKFVKEYGFDKDTILRATQKYIDNEAMNNNYKYLQKAHYFIYKQVGGKDNEISNLASFCEEVQDNVDSKSTSTNVLDLN